MSWENWQSVYHICRPLIYGGCRLVFLRNTHIPGFKSQIKNCNQRPDFVMYKNKKAHKSFYYNDLQALLAVGGGVEPPRGR